MLPLNTFRLISLLAAHHSLESVSTVSLHTPPPLCFSLPADTTMWLGNGEVITREELEKNSPSRQDGISLEGETRLRESYCTFLRDLGKRLGVHDTAIAIAMVLCHRFFFRQSHAKNDRWTIAMVCMFLAAKLRSHQQDLKRVIVFGNEIKDKKATGAVQRQKVFEQQKDTVLTGEKLVMSTLAFDFDVDLPLKPLYKAMGKYLVDEASRAQFAPVAWAVVRDSLWTPLCLQYQPRHIAACAFFHAAEHLKIAEQTHRSGWLQHFDITLAQLKDIRNQMRAFYQKKKVAATRESTGETSDSGDIADRPVPKDMPSTEGGSSNVDLSQGDEDKLKAEGVEKDKSERGGGDNREDSSVGDPAGETSEDVGRQLEKNL